MSTSRHQSPDLDILVKITEILTGPLQFLDKCEQVVTVLADFTDSGLVTLRELDPENFTLSLVASYNYLIPTELSLSSSLPDRAVNLGSPVVVNDYLALETRNPGYVESGVRSGLVIPVQVDGEILGVIGFASKSPDHYQDDTVRVLVAIGAVVGMMITKAELLEDNEVVANIGRIVNSSLVGPDVFERFAAEAARIIKFDRLALNSVNVAEYTYVTEFLLGDQVPNYPIGETQNIEGTALEIVVQTRAGGRFVLDERDGIEPKFPKAGAYVAYGQRYLIGVPLIVGGQVIGTMGFNRGSRHFSHKDLTKAERVANLAAGAFADFKLQEYRVQAEQEIKKNRAILEAEANIGRLFTSPMNDAGSFETIKAEIAKVISLDRIVISAVDVETETFSGAFNELLNESTLMFANNQGQSYEGTLTAEVIRCGEGQIVHSDDPRLESGRLPRVRHTFELGYRSIMAVPMEFESIIIGTLAILSESENAFDDEDLAAADRIGKLLAGAVATFKITGERNRAQSALSESDSRFRQIAESISGVFWLVELEPPRLVYVSPKFEDVWGIPEADIYENYDRLIDIVHPEDLPRVHQSRAQALLTGEIDIEYRIIMPDGSVRWIRSRGFPVRDENGKIFRMSGIGEDITNQKSELEKITEAGRLLSIGELASGVAHEINNPLANINLYSEALITQDLPESVVADLQVILDQGKRAAGVVRNLLQFARKSSPSIATVAAKEFVDRCIELKSYDFRVNNVSVSTEFLLDHTEIAIDESLMTQVVLNIFNNAEQACIAAHARGHISVTMRELDDVTRISISDDGPGISPENLSKVFEPFFTTKEVGEGTGLGLSVSYGIIAQLGGNLWAESDGSTGSTFHIEVPISLKPAPVGSP